MERWEAADRDPELVDDGVLNVVFVGGGPTGIESAGAFAELYRASSPRTIRTCPQDRTRVILVEAGATSSRCSSEDIREYTERRSTKRGVEVMLGETVASVTPTRVDAEVGSRDRRAYARLGRGPAGQPGRRGARRRTRAGRPDPGRARPQRGRPPRDLRRRRHRRDHRAKTTTALPQLGSVALQSGEQAGANIAARIAGKDARAVQVPRQGHDGDDRPRRRGDPDARAATPSPARTASLAWGAVHLALLSTGEDRAKAMIDWTWAGFTHERAGRIASSG